MDILLIEDEANVAAFIKKGLDEQSHKVTVVHDGASGITTAVSQDFDIIILDVILPGVRGLEVCEEIRKHKKSLPILMLTALGSVNDKVRGLESGADDYLTKPFHFEELIARINALTRRKYRSFTDKIYKIADLEIDCVKRTVMRNGKEIPLTAKEFELLEVMAANKNKVLSRSYIAETVWGINFDRGTNFIDVYINYLRTKIDKDFPRKLIHTVIGMGYVLKD
jgi:two-component system copper resistance phosphate regulon response regulator CusR